MMIYRLPYTVYLYSPHLQYAASQPPTLVPYHPPSSAGTWTLPIIFARRLANFRPRTPKLWDLLLLISPFRFDFYRCFDIPAVLILLWWLDDKTRHWMEVLKVNEVWDLIHTDPVSNWAHCFLPDGHCSIPRMRKVEFSRTCIWKFERQQSCAVEPPSRATRWHLVFT